MKKSRTVLIGAGNMGKNHARIYSDLSDFCAISDINEEVGKRLAHQYNVTFYRDYLEMINEIKPDAVSVVVPTKYHYKVATDCLSKGIPTLLEKPIASDLDEANKLIKLAKKQETFLMVGHIERFNPIVPKIKEMIKSGELGKIIYIQSTRTGTIPPKIADSDVGLDLGIHDVDLINFFLDSYPLSKHLINKKVMYQNKSDTALISLEYPNNISSYIFTSWLGPIRERVMRIIGTKLSVELDFITQKIYLYGTTFKSQPHDEYFEFTDTNDAVEKEIYSYHEEPLRNEIQYFLDNLQSESDQKSLESATEALKIFTG